MSKPKLPPTLTHNISSELLQRTVNVALVGCGGNGSQMLYKLARLDFALRECGHPGGLSVCVFDPDQVSPANIGRQLFSPDDVGLYKAIVLVNRINLGYGLAWNAVPEAFTMDRVRVETPDLLITCVDTAKTRREIHHAIEKGRPERTPTYWLDLGNTRDTGQVILGEPGNRNIQVMVGTGTTAVEMQTLSPQELHRRSVAALEAGQKEGKRRWNARRLQTVTEVFPQLLDRRRKEDNAPSCSLAEALDKQSLFVNDHMCVWAMQMLDTLFREGKIDYHGVFINLKSGAARPLMIRERAVEKTGIMVPEKSRKAA